MWFSFSLHFPVRIHNFKLIHGWQGPHSDFSCPTSGSIACVLIIRNNKLVVPNIYLSFSIFLYSQTIITMINHAIGASGVISKACKAVVQQYGQNIMDMLLAKEQPMASQPTTSGDSLNCLQSC